MALSAPLVLSMVSTCQPGTCIILNSIGLQRRGSLLHEIPRIRPLLLPLHKQETLPSPYRSHPLKPELAPDTHICSYVWVGRVWRAGLEWRREGNISCAMSSISQREDPDQKNGFQNPPHAVHHLRSSFPGSASP